MSTTVLPACGIDIGGTKIAGALVAPDGTVLVEDRVSSPASEPDAIADAVVGLVTRLADGHDLAGVGVGAAGYIDERRRTVRFSPNIAWRDEPLADRLSDRLAAPVVIENDANAAAWGEFRFGAGADLDHQLLITVGTGVGGGVVMDGQLLRGGFGSAAEVGHLRMVPDGPLCGCGQRGCLEQYGSGTALVAAARAAARSQPHRAAALLERADGDSEAITGQMVTDAARAGDRLALEQFDYIGHWLGQGIASLAAVLDPEVVVVGGGVSDAGDLLLDPIRASFEKALSAAAFRPVAQIRRAELGGRAGVLGAADLSRG